MCVDRDKERPYTPKVSRSRQNYCLPLIVKKRRKTEEDTIQMKKTLGNMFLAAVVLMGMSTVASAATCSNQAISVGFSCSLGGLTFDFSNLTFAPTSQGDTLQLDTSTAVSGGDVVLGFQINPGTAGFPVDLLLGYTVTSDSQNITGIDASYAGTNGSIIESASAGGVIVSTIDDANTGSNNGVVFNGTPATFGPFTSITISKDIDAISFSEFTDSVQVSGV